MYSYPLLKWWSHLKALETAEVTTRWTVQNTKRKVQKIGVGQSVIFHAELWSRDNLAGQIHADFHLAGLPSGSPKLKGIFKAAPSWPIKRRPESRTYSGRLGL